jgi:hypothetical protein
MAPSRRIWVYHNKVWTKGTVVCNTPPSKKSVQLDGHALSILIGKKPTMSIKHNGKRLKNVRAEVIPTKAVSPRPERFRPLEIVVEAVAFTRPGTIGDYRWQLQAEQYQEFGRALHVYNENIPQQLDKMSCLPGGGNACARPYRQYGKSIGMPTGCYGGFKSLDEKCSGIGFCLTAKEGIDMATEEIIMQVCDYPDRYDKIYYCKNADDDEELIGMGIFHIEDTTRRYITDKLKSLPSAIRQRSIERRRSVRA